MINAINYMENHLSKDIKIEAMAELQKMSKNSFIRLFKKKTGVPPYQYLMKMRIDLGRQMLLASEKPIIAIASQCGFSDRFHFSKAFKREIGTPPAAMRKG